MDTMWKNTIILSLSVFFVIVISPKTHSQLGGSVSFSIDKALSLNIFYTKDKNSYYLGYSYQFNGQKNTVVRKRKKTYGTTPIEDGDFYWLIDFGYSRLFLEKISIQPEFSIGRKNYFISYKDNRFKDNGYSLINSYDAIVGIGMNIGYKINGLFEPYLGFHSIKKVNLGIRIHIGNL